MPQPTSRTRLSSVPCVTSTGSVRLVDINRAAAQTEAHLRRHHHVWLDGEAVVQECPSRRDAWFSNAIRGRLRTESPPWVGVVRWAKCWQCNRPGAAAGKRGATDHDCAIYDA